MAKTEGQLGSKTEGQLGSKTEGQPLKEPVLNVQAKSSTQNTRFYEFMCEAYNDYLQDSSIWGIVKGNGSRDRWIKLTKADCCKTYEKSFGGATFTELVHPQPFADCVSAKHQEFKKCPNDSTIIFWVNQPFPSLRNEFDYLRKYGFIQVTDVKTDREFRMYCFIK